MSNDKIEAEELTGDDDQFEKLMRGVGKRTEIPEAVRKKAERHFRRELGQANASRQRSRTSVRYAIAATLVLSALVVLNLTRQESGSDVVVAVIDEYIGEGFWQTNGTLRPLARGNQLNVGATITTSNGYIRLALFDSNVDLRIGKNSRLLIMDRSTLKLERGSVYIDAETDKEHLLTISTEFGDIQHIGTQYLVVAGSNELRIAVREGRIRYTGDAGELLAGPSGLQAELLKINRAGEQTRQYISKSGNGWLWVNKVSPEFPFEDSARDKSLLTFLTWYARETGREIRYANDQTELQVKQERLGNIGSLSAIVERDGAIEEFVGNFGLTVTRLEEGVILLNSDKK